MKNDKTWRMHGEPHIYWKLVVDSHQEAHPTHTLTLRQRGFGQARDEVVFLVSWSPGMWDNIASEATGAVGFPKFAAFALENQHVD